MSPFHHEGAKIPIKMSQEWSLATQQVRDSEWAL